MTDRRAQARVRLHRMQQRDLEPVHAPLPLMVSLVLVLLCVLAIVGAGGWMLHAYVAAKSVGAQ